MFQLCSLIFGCCHNDVSESGSWNGEFVRDPRDIFPNDNLIGDRDSNLMARIMFDTRDDVPSVEGTWRPRAAILSYLKKKNFDGGWSHGSAVLVEVTKYLCMSR